MTTQESALLLIDLQNDFFSGGRLAVPNAEQIVTPICLLLSAAIKANLPIFASRDWHPKDSVQFTENGGPWPTHCVAGSHGAQFYKSLRLPENSVVINKGVSSNSHGYSAFETSAEDGHCLADELSLRGTRSIYVAGLATDYCVLHTVLDAMRLSFHAVLVTDASAAVENTEGDSEKALAQMRTAGARFENSRQVLGQFARIP